MYNKVRRTAISTILIALLMTLMTAQAPAAKTDNSNKSKGAAGRDLGGANTILNGKGVPKPTLGVDGDFYIDVVTFNIYGPKKAGKWGVGVSLRGPQGASGSDGKAGEKGSTGNSSAGAKGDKGDKGERGEKGEKGEPGSPGASGAQGPAGEAGAQGPAGSQGATGAQGPAGANGTNGTNGSKGDTGEKGDQGIPGERGAIGLTGPAGQSKVTTGSITFASTLQGSANEVLLSGTFGVVESQTSYNVRVLLIGTNSDNSAIPINFEVIRSNTAVLIESLHWTPFSLWVYRNNTLKYEQGIQANFFVDGRLANTNSTLSVRLTTGSDLSNPNKHLTFTGMYQLIQVGEIN